LCPGARHRRCQTGGGQRKEAAYPAGTPLSTPGQPVRRPSTAPVLTSGGDRTPGAALGTILGSEVGGLGPAPRRWCVRTIVALMSPGVKNRDPKEIRVRTCQEGAPHRDAPS